MLWGLNLASSLIFIVYIEDIKFEHHIIMQELDKISSQLDFTYVWYLSAMTDTGI